MAYGNRLHLQTIISWLLNKLHKCLTLTTVLAKNVRIFWGKKAGKWTISKKNDMTERARGLGKKQTREEIRKQNRMTTLRYQTGARPNSKHWFMTSFLGGRCQKVVLGVWGQTSHSRPPLGLELKNIFKNNNIMYVEMSTCKIVLE